MLFREMPLKGAYLIEPEPRYDERGSMARTFCRREFEAHGLNPFIAQCSLSSNRYRGTIRGLHYQIEPYAETKLLSCIKGAIYDVIIDLRHESPSFGQWTAIELRAADRLLLYVPQGFAHGFQTLENNSEVFYQISQFYQPAFARGLRWNDPAFNIKWPLKLVNISEQDCSWPLFSPYREKANA
ncbi:MAG: dTDP-4-dehydrorhamnose 3,5-epimerase [Syntrophomonas sp.]